MLLFTSAGNRPLLQTIGMNFTTPASVVVACREAGLSEGSADANICFPETRALISAAHAFFFFSYFYDEFHFPVILLIQLLEFDLIFSNASNYCHYCDGRSLP